MLVDGKRVWQTFEEIMYDDSDFGRIGADYERAGMPVSKNRLSRLLPIQALCDFGKEWLETYR